MALFFTHLTGALAAAIFGDPDDLARHTAAAMPLLTATLGLYPTAVGYLLRGLALAEQARAADRDHRDGLLVELDEAIRWLAARAADAPDNFLYLLRLLEAERAWAVGDFRAAALAFDAARREVAGRQRPWHRALIAEHAARFYLAHGADHAGYDLLAQARHDYLAWGATAKVAQLDWAYPAVRPQAEATTKVGGDQPGDLSQRRSTVTTGSIDLLGILSASQALSSQTSLERLHARVAEVLSAMTGATRVHLAVWSENLQTWQLPTSGDGGGPVALSGSGRDDVVPLSVLRYAQRTGEALAVDDATRDDRFFRDPYFTDVDCCALLALPIFSRGALQAVLLLENRLLRGAFTAGRLDAVKLIAGQLAVSLDNARLYEELTASRARIVAAADQTRQRLERDLHDGAQQRLVALALRLRADELDELASEAASVLDELREVARGIHPAVLAKGGLAPALKTLARRSVVPVQLDVRVHRRLPEPIEIAAYYLVSEALTNTAKHAHASEIRVEVDNPDRGGVLRVSVRDDGHGGADLAGGSGLVGLKDRVEALGGRFWVHSALDAGTVVQADLPLDLVTTASD